MHMYIYLYSSVEDPGGGGPGGHGGYGGPVPPPRPLGLEYIYIIYVL